MSDPQLDHPATWRKAYRKTLGLPGMSTLEFALYCVLERAGMRDLTRLDLAGQPRPDVGWGVRDNGQPLTRRELATYCRLPAGPAGQADLDAAIASLVELGNAVVAADGAVGLVGWVELQESPERARVREEERRARDAERKRESRRQAATSRPLASDRCPRTESEHGADTTRTRPPTSAESNPPEDRGQRTEDLPPTAGEGLDRLRRARTNAPLSLTAAERSGLHPDVLRRLEDGRAAPTPAGALADIELLPHDPAAPERIVAQHHELAVEFGRAKPGPPPRVTEEDLRVIRSTQEGAETEARWLLVLRRWGERCRRDPSKIDLLTLSFLARPSPRAEMLANATLDKPQVRGRSPPKEATRPSARSKKSDRDVETE